VQGGGHIAPGESVGSLGIGNLVLTQSAEFNVELDPRNVQGNGMADLLNVTGSVNLGLGDLVLNLHSAPLPGETFTILENDGVDPIVGLFAQGAQVSDTFAGQTYLFSINYHADADGGGVNGGNDIVLSSVPEPSPAMLALFGLSILLICPEVTLRHLGRTRLSQKRTRLPTGLNAQDMRQSREFRRTIKVY
jgi:hypothetical protein